MLNEALCVYLICISTKVAAQRQVAIFCLVLGTLVSVSLSGESSDSEEECLEALKIKNGKKYEAVDPTARDEHTT